MAKRCSRIISQRRFFPRAFIVGFALLAGLGVEKAAAQAAHNVEITIDGVMVMSVVTPFVRVVRDNFHNVLNISPKGELTVQATTNAGLVSAGTTRFGRTNEMQNPAGAWRGAASIRPGNRIEHRSRVTTNAGSTIDIVRNIQIHGDSCIATVNYRIGSRGGLRVNGTDGQSVTIDRVWSEGVTCRIRSL